MQSFRTRFTSSVIPDQCLDCQSLSQCKGCVALRACPISKLPAHINQRMRRAIETRFYTPGCVIASQGQPAEGLFIVRAGWVKTVFQAQTERQFASGLYGPGNVLALPDVMMAGRFSFSIETIEDCEIEFLSAGDLRSLMVDEPAVAVHLLQLVSKQFLQAMADVHEGTGASIPERLLRVLCDLAAQCGRDTGDGVRMRLPFTVQHLADLVGCSRQWATKALTELEDKGLVHRSRGWITVSPSAVRPRTPEAPVSARTRVAPRKSDLRKNPVSRSAPCKECS